MDGDNMDSNQLAEEFVIDTFTLEDLETTIRPLLSSTPRDRTKQTYRKRQRVPYELSSDQSFKGLFYVQLMHHTLFIQNQIQMKAQCKYM